MCAPCLIIINGCGAAEASARGLASLLDKINTSDTIITGGSVYASMFAATVKEGAEALIAGIDRKQFTAEQIESIGPFCEALREHGKKIDGAIVSILNADHDADDVRRILAHFITWRQDVITFVHDLAIAAGGYHERDH